MSVRCHSSESAVTCRWRTDRAGVNPRGRPHGGCGASARGSTVNATNVVGNPAGDALWPFCVAAAGFGFSTRVYESAAAGYYVTVMNHHAISGERMSFDALVSFEYEDYAATNERTSTCPFDCSNHGICVRTGFFRGMCVCFKGYAGFYCQNNATKLIPNDEESVFERKIRPGDWENF